MEIVVLVLMMLVLVELMVGVVTQVRSRAWSHSERVVSMDRWHVAT